MRKLASIQEILNLEPIEGADKIMKATVQGWELVVKKDEFKIGDKCVYIEIDSVVPERPEFEFLRSRKFRVKTAKFKGVTSQGLALPLSILPRGEFYAIEEDVTEILGITKYDPQGDKERALLKQKENEINNKLIKHMLRYNWFRRVILKPERSKFPSFIKKTDETRVQNLPHICENEKDTIFEISEKLDGQSATYFLIKKPKKWYNLLSKNSYEFGVCSRNLHLPKANNSSYWTIAKDLQMEEVLQGLIGDNKYIVVQGEIIGEGVQGNKYNIKGYDFYAYNLIMEDKKLDNLYSAELLREYGIKFVPILHLNYKLPSTIKEIVQYSEGYSLLKPDVIREGVVIRNYEKGLSFKAINPKFLLKNNE